MSTTYDAAPRLALIAASLKSFDRGISSPSGATMSSRHCDGFLITPAQTPDGGLIADDISAVHHSGRADGPHPPANDWRVHQAIYASRPDIDAVARLQTPAATALAMLRLGVPAVHQSLIDSAGGDLRCSDFAPAGSIELAKAAVIALRGRTACILANNALVTCGSSVAEATRRAAEIEAVCDHYLRARAIGQPIHAADPGPRQPLQLVDLRT